MKIWSSLILWLKYLDIYWIYFHQSFVQIFMMPSWLFLSCHRGVDSCQSDALPCNLVWTMMFSSVWIILLWSFWHAETEQTKRINVSRSSTSRNRPYLGVADTSGEYWLTWHWQSLLSAGAGVFLLASAESEQISFLFDCIVRGISPTRGPFGLRPVLPGQFQMCLKRCFVGKRTGIPNLESRRETERIICKERRLQKEAGCLCYAYFPIKTSGFAVTQGVWGGEKLVSTSLNCVKPCLAPFLCLQGLS